MKLSVKYCALFYKMYSDVVQNAQRCSTKCSVLHLLRAKTIQRMLYRKKYKKITISEFFIVIPLLI